MKKERTVNWSNRQNVLEIESCALPWGEKQHQEYLRRKEFLPVFEVKLRISHDNEKDKFKMSVREYPGTSQVYPYGHVIITGQYMYYNVYVRGRDEINHGFMIILGKLEENLLGVCNAGLISNEDAQRFIDRYDAYSADFLKSFNSYNVPTPHYTKICKELKGC